MPVLSAFTPCGLLEFDASTSDAENIYNTLKTQLGATFDLSPGTYEEAKIYAVAMQIAWARCIIKRVPREMHPLTCYDMLTTLEKDWACVPSAKDTLFQRQMRVAARKLVMRGSREEAIVTDLIAAIGSDFIKLNACPTGSATNYPTTPATVGTFPNPAVAPKFYRLVTPVNDNTRRISVTLSCINGSAYPFVGETLTFEPEISGISEAVIMQTVTAVDAATCIVTPSVPFTRAHSVSGWAITAAPLWLSNRYQLQIVVTDASSRVAEKRRKVNEVLARHARSCERWKIVAASSSTQVGPLLFGVGNNRIGATALGASATPF